MKHRYKILRELSFNTTFIEQDKGMLLGKPLASFVTLWE